MHSVKVASWNVLADAYVSMMQNRDEFVWDKRKDSLRREVLKAISDLGVGVFALQEVDHYEDFYKPLFEDANFNVIFNKRPGNIPDGCAIAYNKTLFTLIQHQVVDLDSVGLKDDSIQKGNIAQISLLKHNQSSILFYLINTHLHWRPEFSELKLLQVQTIFSHLNADIKPVILCGDFNSPTTSPVYQLLGEGTCVMTACNRGFVCDQNLAKLARQLQSCGKVCVVHEDLNTILDEFTRHEKKILLTASKKLYSRSLCPPQSLLLPPHSRAMHLRTVLQLDTTVPTKSTYKALLLRQEDRAYSLSHKLVDAHASLAQRNTLRWKDQLRCSDYVFSRSCTVLSAFYTNHNFLIWPSDHSLLFAHLVLATGTSP